MMMEEILQAYGLRNANMVSFGTGLINRTWKVIASGKQYILQQVNNQVFHEPPDIAYNVRIIAEHLKEYHPGYFFVAPVSTVDKKDMLYIKDHGWFRLLPFVENSTAYDVVQTPEQAFEAARQFGRFTRLLAGFDTKRLKITIPKFHDLDYRYQQFQDTLSSGNKDRIMGSQSLINELIEYRSLVDQFNWLIQNPQIKVRVTHHDTKISNVLFDPQGNGLCVIDLDTIMPGYFFTDVGDMMRTCLSPVNEEENDLEKVVVRPDFFTGIVEGYMGEMKDELTADEKTQFHFAAKCMIYMQALRFMTDHLDNDRYYSAKYEGHNLMRAKNQAALLREVVKLLV